MTTNIPKRRETCGRPRRSTASIRQRLERVDADHASRASPGPSQVQAIRRRPVQSHLLGAVARATLRAAAQAAGQAAAPSAHAVDREFRVLAALERYRRAGGARACAVRGPRGDRQRFYVMDYVEGRIFWDALLPEVAAAGPPRRSTSEMVRVLAALHSVDYAAVGPATMANTRARAGRDRLDRLGPAAVRHRLPALGLRRPDPGAADAAARAAAPRTSSSTTR